MIYNLYFEANKQAHVIRLGEPKGSFIQYLTINTNGRDELLTIDKAIMLVSSTSKKKKKKVCENQKDTRQNRSSKSRCASFSKGFRLAHYQQGYGNVVRRVRRLTLRRCGLLR